MIKIKSGFERKLRFYSFILLGLMMSISGIISYSVSQSIIIGEIRKIYSSSMREAVSRANMIMGEMVNIINIIVEDDLIQKDRVFYSVRQNRTDEDNIQRRKWEEYLTNFTKDYDIIDFIMLLKNNDIYISMNSYLLGFQKDPEKIENLKQKLTEKMNNQKSYGDIYLAKLSIHSKEQLVLFTHIGSKSTGEDYLIIALNNNLQKQIQFPGIYSYLISDTNAIYINDPETETPIITRQVIEKCRETASTQYEKVSNNLLFFNSPLNIKGWNIVNVVNINNIMNQTRLLGIIILIVTLLSFIAVWFLSRFFTKRISNSIKSLQFHISSLIDNEFRELNPWAGNSAGQNIFHRKFSLRTRMLLYFCLVVIIPVLIITGVTYTKSKYILENNLGGNIEDKIARLSYQANFMMKNYEKTCMYIANNQSLQKYLQDYYRNNGKSFEERQRDISWIFLNKLIFFKDIINITIYDESRVPFYSLLFNETISNVNKYKDDFHYIFKNNPYKLWKGVASDYFNNRFFRLGMRIRRIEDSTPLGYLFLDFNINQIQEIFDAATENSEISLFIVDSEGNAIYIPSDSTNLTANLNKVKKLSDRKGSSKFGIGDNSYYLFYESIDVNDWKIVAIVPMEEYIKESNKILLYNILLLLIFMVVIFVISLQFSGSIMKNINRLKTAMEVVQEGVFKPLKIKKTKDEIEELGNNFNVMIERINALINEIYVAKIDKANTEIKLKEAQFNALQAQINPHFLYNTLETIQYMIVLGDKRAKRMLQLLGDLFRFGIGKGEKFVTVCNEIEHIKLYLEIQQMRYSNKFSVEFDIDEKVYDLYTVKFILQPIVENAIYHGIELVEEGGVINISGGIQEGKLVFQIKDNGAGMDENTLSDLYDRLEGKIKSKSIGIMNVHERIQLYFGKEFGVEVQSLVNVGTVVTLRLPILNCIPNIIV